VVKDSDEKIYLRDELEAMVYFRGECLSNPLNYDLQAINKGNYIQLYTK